MSNYERITVIDDLGRLVERTVLVIACDCGEHVYCSDFTNVCFCGKDYDDKGEILASRSQWG